MNQQLEKMTVRIGRGHLGGRLVRFQAMPDLRPTLSRVREAVFSMVHSYSETHGFVDLCAGSGVMGFEASSVGFDPVTLMDTHGDCLRVIEENRKLLGIEAQVLKGSAHELKRWLDSSRPQVIYADPPYRESDFHQKMLSALSKDATLAPGSLYVAEYQDKKMVLAAPGFEALKQKSYGRAQILILEWTAQKIVGDP